jgi:epoxyqueuosine reductase
LESAAMSPEGLTGQLKAEARRQGFELVGATPAIRPPRLGAFEQWLADGFAGKMDYIPRRAAAYEHPRHVLDGVRSLLMLGMVYRTEEPAEPEAGQGTIARYAWGTDYHDLIHDRLHALADFHRQLTPDAAVRGVVDTAPLLEREFAERAGLGWVGKNTLLLNRRLGSWFLLAALLTSEELAYDEPVTAGHCGTCRACIDACPTGAIVEPYRLDARKCISYLTIELREPIPPEQRQGIGPQVFGCDICQDVCPFNRRSSPTTESSFQPRPGANPIDLAEVLQMDETAFRQRFRGSPVLRATRRGLVCQAAYALGNRPDRKALPALKAGLEDSDSAVQEACAWAIERYGCNEALDSHGREGVH